MFSKRYITFKQTLDNLAKKWLFSWIQDGDWLIRNILVNYSANYKPKKSIFFLLFKYFIFFWVIWMIIFSFNANFNHPSIKWHVAQTKLCAERPSLPECRHWVNPLEKEDSIFIVENHRIWVIFSNILMYFLFITYLPYTVYLHYKNMKNWDVSIFYWVRKIFYAFLFTYYFIPITWYIWGFLWSVSLLEYYSYIAIPYEYFWSFSIPWIL